MARKTSKAGLKRRSKPLAGGGEETPITISGGSIHVEFKPEFDEEEAPSATKKAKKVKHPDDTRKFTRVQILLDGTEVHAFPTPGTELDENCEIRIKAKKK